MRTFLIVAVLCASGAAKATLVYGASDVFDTATGLDWSYLVPAGFQSLDSIENRTDGQRLATAAEVRTFFADAGLTASSGVFSPPSIPPGLQDLVFRWGVGASTGVHAGTIDYFITLPDTPQVGEVGTGRVSILNIGGQNNYSYTDEADGTPTPYPPVAFGPQRFGAALVRAVPEPGTYALLLSGLVGVAVGRARKKASPAE